MNTTTMMKVGEFSVDSGQFMIIDPCYVWDDNFNLSGEPTGKPYDTACRLTSMNEGKTWGELEGGFVACTPYGDGSYEVHAEVDEYGRIVRLTVDFDYSSDDWDEDEDEDEDENSVRN